MVVSARAVIALYLTAALALSVTMQRTPFGTTPDGIAVDLFTLANDHGVEAEVIDPRTLRPLDLPTVLASVERTNRLLAVEEGPRTGGWAAGLREHFSEEQIVELGYFVALTFGQQRWIKTLGIGHGEVLGDTAAGLAPPTGRP